MKIDNLKNVGHKHAIASTQEKAGCLRPSGFFAGLLLSFIVFMGGSSTAYANITLPGGLYVVTHWFYGEVQFNKNATRFVDVYGGLGNIACGALKAVPEVGTALYWECRIEISWWRIIAHQARSSGQCLRLVSPAYRADLTYPSTYRGGWCR